MLRGLAVVTATFVLALVGSGSAGAALRVSWMPGFRAPGTPTRYDRVGVIKVGAADARNVLVLEPGTSAAAAYFVPLAKWIVSRAPGWQVWAVERRENLLEDQSVLDLVKRGKAGSTELFDYYLGYLIDHSIKRHFNPVANSSVEFAKGWGMNVAVQDLHRVIAAARKLGGNVVLGGHSLGGSVVTAYATWDFGGRAGAAGLAGLVYDDGGSGPAETAQSAQTALAQLDAPSATPWLAFGGIPAPEAGVLEAAGSVSALLDPDAPSIAQASGLLGPFHLSPSVPVTNAGQYGYALNVGSSPANLAAAQAHLGLGLSTHTVHGYHTWNGSGALTPLNRFAEMFAGAGIPGANGTEWYFPQRLTDDTAAVGDGNANPAQAVLDVHATMGHRLPHRLLMYAFATSLGQERVLLAAQALAAQSHIPPRNLSLVDRQNSYAHNDPAGAYPRNAFFSGLIRFLRRVG